MANLQPITGTDGYIAWLNGTPATLLAEPMSQILSMPGGSLVYPANQIFQVTARTHKVMDPRVTPIVYVGGVSQAPTSYIVYWGAGIVYFRTPLTGTPTVTMDYTYIPTATATQVIGLQHVNNWQLTMTGNQIVGDEYGTIIAPAYRGKLAGTWQFDRFSSSTSIDLFNTMLTQSYFIFALYESLSAARIWIVYGDLTSAPVSAPGGGMVGGTVNGVMRQTPTFLNETL